MEKRNQRKAYGETLLKLGKDDKNIVVLEADLGKSTMSCLFGEAYPERYFQMGIAEQNMASTAAGLALTGKTAFINSFAVFSTGRAYDQIRSSVCIPALNVKVCGSSAGLSDFGDGKTHQSIDDIALMRVLPNMKVFSPLDAVETEKIVKAMTEDPGPCYIRLNRNDLPVYTKPEEEYHVGKLSLIKDGTDAVVFACGVTVTVALEAADILEKEGVSVRVVNVSTIKPLDREGLLKYCRGMKATLTAEEHSIHGGLGGAVCEALSTEGIPVEIIGVEDTFGTSAENYEVLLHRYGFTGTRFAERIRAALARNQGVN